MTTKLLTKRTLYTVAASLAALVLPMLTWIGFQAVTRHLALAQIKPSAFTIKTTQRFACFNGGDKVPDFSSMTLSKEQVVAVQGDGSSVRKMHFPRRGTTERYIRMADGQYIVSYDEVNKKSHGNVGKDQLLDQPNPATGCLTTFRGQAANEEASIDGYEAVSGLRTVRIKAGPSDPRAPGWHHLRWQALDYACTTVREDSIFIPDVSRPDGKQVITRNITELVSVENNEPDPTMFFTGTHDNVKPSQRVSARLEFAATKTGRKVDKAELEAAAVGLKKQDDNWEKTKTQ